MKKWKKQVAYIAPLVEGVVVWHSDSPAEGKEPAPYETVGKAYLDAVVEATRAQAGQPHKRGEHERRAEREE